MRYPSRRSSSAILSSLQLESSFGPSPLGSPDEVPEPAPQLSDSLEDEIDCQVNKGKQHEDNPPIISLGHETAPSVLVVPPSPVPVQRDGSADFEPDAPRMSIEDPLATNYVEEPDVTDNRFLQVPPLMARPMGGSEESEKSGHDDLQPARITQYPTTPTSLGTIKWERPRPRFALTFPDLVPSDCEIQPDFTFLFFITILFCFPSITIPELLSVKDGGMKPGDLARLEAKMNRLGALIPVIGIILGIELCYMLYMHGHNLCFVMADGLSSTLLPVFCNDRYCIV